MRRRNPVAALVHVAALQLHRHQHRQLVRPVPHPLCVRVLLHPVPRNRKLEVVVLVLRDRHVEFSIGRIEAIRNELRLLRLDANVAHGDFLPRVVRDVHDERQPVVHVFAGRAPAAEPDHDLDAAVLAVVDRVVDRDAELVFRIGRAGGRGEKDERKQGEPFHVPDFRTSIAHFGDGGSNMANHGFGGPYARDDHFGGLGDEYARDRGWSGGGRAEDVVRDVHPRRISFRGRGPKNWNMDERIREAINDWLTDHDAVDATDVEVEVANGEVTLNGTVNSRYEKRLAEDVAMRCRGVHDVHNRLTIADRETPVGKASE
ncbi:MAG: hypothetical protein DMF56_10595 [Acidobacteria bacterium]|nr:MAG: hypothetical protein DMF56_10595 [Acidobacteriota bacterium]